MEVQVGPQGQAPGPPERLLRALGPVVPDDDPAVDLHDLADLVHPCLLEPPATGAGQPLTDDRTRVPRPGAVRREPGAGRPTSTRTSSPGDPCPRPRRWCPRMSSGAVAATACSASPIRSVSPRSDCRAWSRCRRRSSTSACTSASRRRGRGGARRSRSRAASASSRSRSAAASRSSSGGLAAGPAPGAAVASARSAARVVLQLVGGDDRHLLDLVGLAQPRVGLGPRLGQQPLGLLRPRLGQGRGLVRGELQHLLHPVGDREDVPAAGRVGQQPAGDLELGRAARRTGRAGGRPRAAAWSSSASAQAA